MYYQVQKSACMSQSAELILWIRSHVEQHGTKQWGFRAHLDPTLPEREGVRTPGVRTHAGSPPLLVIFTLPTSQQWLLRKLQVGWKEMRMETAGSRPRGPGEASGDRTLKNLTTSLPPPSYSIFVISSYSFHGFFSYRLAVLSQFSEHCPIG